MFSSIAAFAIRFPRVVPDRSANGEKSSDIKSTRLKVDYDVSGAHISGSE
jgi:hypothetical protein